MITPFSSTSAERVFDFYLSPANAYGSLFIVHYASEGNNIYGLNIVSEAMDSEEQINEGFLPMPCGHDTTEDYREIKTWTDCFIKSLKENGAVPTEYRISSIGRIEEMWYKIFGTKFKKTAKIN